MRGRLLGAGDGLLALDHLRTRLSLHLHARLTLYLLDSRLHTGLSGRNLLALLKLFLHGGLLLLLSQSSLLLLGCYRLLLLLGQSLLLLGLLLLGRCLLLLGVLLLHDGLALGITEGQLRIGCDRCLVADDDRAVNGDVVGDVRDRAVGQVAADLQLAGVAVALVLGQHLAGRALAEHRLGLTERG